MNFQLNHASDQTLWRFRSRSKDDDDNTEEYEAGSCVIFGVVGEEIDQHVN